MDGFAQDIGPYVEQGQRGIVDGYEVCVFVYGEDAVGDIVEDIVQLVFFVAQGTEAVLQNEGNGINLAGDCVDFLIAGRNGRRRVFAV